MKRLWIGLGILLLLLALGIGVTKGMETIHTPICEQLRRAEAAAAEQDWAEADALSDAARQRWQTWHRFTAAFADHVPMDEIDSLFAELAVYARARDKDHFCAICAQLSQLVRAMAESHSPTWWNLL